MSGGMAAAVLAAVVVLVVAAWFSPHILAIVLCLVALGVVAGAALAAISAAEARAQAAGAAAEAELHAFQALMGDLPELALAMDLHGRSQAVFGRPIPGLDPDSLHGGLADLAIDEDRPRVEAALASAAGDGYAETDFLPVEPEAPRLAAAIQRTGAAGLLAVLRPAPDAWGRGPILAPAGLAQRTHAEEGGLNGADPAGELARRLHEAETARTEAEAGRLKAEADATGRARFLANMSHELRTPLNAIMGFSDIMRTRLFGDLLPKYAEYAELIHESGGHLLDLINDVLDMSKIEARRFELSREVFDAREAVSGALRLVRVQADEAGVGLRGVLPVGPLEIDADRRAVKQIVLNLVSNALKFTPAGGSVTVTVERAGDAFELVVADTGVGIAAEDLERLGKPYEQAGGADARAQGTGLGLSLVRAFAELHGGRMTLESRLGEGTAVTVRLPVLAGVEIAPAVIEPPMPKVAPGGAPDAP